MEPALAAIKNEVDALRTQLNTWAHAYYVNDAPTVPDAEYDRLYQRLQALEAQHPELITPESITQRVGGAVMDGLAPVRHAVPMLSIRTETDTEASGAEAFDARVRRELGLDQSAPPLEYVAEPKFDGLAMSLRWQLLKTKCRRCARSSTLGRTLTTSTMRRRCRMRNTTASTSACKP